MSFIIKVSAILSILIIIMCINYHSFDFTKRSNELKDVSLKFYVNPSFMFKSQEYKEFVYVK